MYLMLNATPFFTVLFLIVLEGLLSVDNALVLAIMVRGLEPTRRKKALIYGVWGAIGFRILALFCLTWLMRITWIKFVGGGYLVGLALSHFFWPSQNDAAKKSDAFSFWKTVLLVEAADISFSADSILASLSVSDSYIILMIGGILGILTMRVAANIFVWLLDRFPRIESSAYLLVLVMGVKLITQGVFPHLNFNSTQSLAPWAFWSAALLALSYGFMHPRKVAAAA